MATIDYSTTKIVTAPIGLKGVVELVNASKYCVGKACTANGINIWAKYKPQSYGVIFGLTDAQRKLNSWGFVYKKQTYTTNMDTLYDGAMNGWTYVRPSGGASSPYRLGDFMNEDQTIGYDHNADYIFNGFDVPKEFDINDGVDLDLSASFKSASQYEISASDYGFSDYYLGVVALTPKGGYVRYVSTTTVSAATGGSATIVISREDIGIGVYTFYPVMFTSSNGNEFITIPYTTPSTCTVKNSGSTPGGCTMDAEFMWSTDFSMIGYTIGITNDDTTDVSVANFRVVLHKVSSDETSTTTYDLGSVTVAGGGSYDLKGDINVSYDSAYDYYFTFEDNAITDGDTGEYTIQDPL